MWLTVVTGHHAVEYKWRSKTANSVSRANSRRGEETDDISSKSNIHRNSPNLFHLSYMTLKLNRILQGIGSALCLVYLLLFDNNMVQREKASAYLIQASYPKQAGLSPKQPISFMVEFVLKYY